jgi:hypothetical protein
VSKHHRPPIVLWREALLGGSKGLPVPLSPLAQHVAFVLAEFLTPRGMPYPGDPTPFDRLAEASYRGESTVRKGIAELVEKGYLIRVERGRAGRATKYRIGWPESTAHPRAVTDSYALADERYNSSPASDEQERQVNPQVGDDDFDFDL